MSMIDGFPIKTVIRERVTCPACGSALVRPMRGAPHDGGKAYYLCLVEVCGYSFPVIVVRDRDSIKWKSQEKIPEAGDAGGLGGGSPGRNA